MKEHLTVILDWMESSGDFVREQAPLVVQEILLWGQVRYGGQAAAFAVAAILATLLTRRFLAGSKDDDARYTGLFGGYGLSVILCYISAFNVSQLLYVVTAPRLYVISELKSLIVY